ncbi:MAG: radical SAM protein [Smithellaceae bacterium]|jgi:putative pyruvate formate lyase activating enzyme|nr:radical SAM protein [Syntrophaceae bacterium]NMD05732.1 radical SAM protein [Deltaproteobacteria bacterium]HNT91974.1 radical SAM protein [Smithellaceae bacterium]MBP8609848.1 radical SAM protein [Syntrophaceae bacterium]HNZ32307.1 radical SAM protein [Smithellaceae bacterium]
MPAEEKIIKLKKILDNCVLCPRACRVNRAQGELGFCKLPAKIIMDCALAHHGEEPPLSGHRGAGTIFLVSCNLGCVYCQNYQISQSTEGQKLTVEQMAEVMLDLQKRGCHNVEPVTPTPQTPLIMEALVLARAKGLEVPFVYNCGGYENPEVIKLLDGMVEIYLPDFKYGQEDVAVEYSAAPGYPRFALASLKEMVRQVGDELELENGVAKKGVITRHLVLPGKIENSKEVFRLIKKEISLNVPISLMSQYSPPPKVRRHPLLSRRITPAEYREVLDYALKLGFRNLFIQEVNEYELTPDFNRENPFD